MSNQKFRCFWCDCISVSWKSVLLLVVTLIYVVKAQPCKDLSQCSFWASQGECENDPENKLQICPRACRNPCRCDVSLVSNDTACDCLVRVKADESYCNTTSAKRECWTTCNKVAQVSCPVLLPPDDPNASLSTWSTRYLTSVTEICNDGYLPKVPTNQGKKTCSGGGRWVEDAMFGDPVECIPVDCGTPPSPAHTFCLAFDTILGSRADCVCAIGYLPQSGQTTLNCSSSGLWEGQPLTCAKVDCGPPPNSSNARVTVAGVDFGSSANYTCSVGYIHVGGDTTLTCNSTGSWHGSLIVCTVIDCGPPLSDASVSVQFTGTTFGHNASYACATGYVYSSGDTDLTCDLSGRWSGNLMTCLVIDCGPPLSDASVSVQFTGTTFGHNASYACATGYTYSSGDTDLTCDLSGRWSGNMMTCLANGHQVTTDKASSSINAPIGWAVGMAVLALIIALIVLFVLIRAGKVRKSGKNLKKKDTSQRKEMRFLSFQFWVNLRKKSSSWPEVSDAVKPDVHKPWTTAHLMSYFSSVAPSGTRPSYLTISRSHQKLSSTSNTSSSLCSLDVPKTPDRLSVSNSVSDISTVASPSSLTIRKTSNILPVSISPSDIPIVKSPSRLSTVRKTSNILHVSNSTNDVSNLRSPSRLSTVRKTSNILHVSNSTNDVSNLRSPSRLSTVRKTSNILHVSNSTNDVSKSPSRLSTVRKTSNFLHVSNSDNNKLILRSPSSLASVRKTSNSDISLVKNNIHTIPETTTTTSLSSMSDSSCIKSLPKSPSSVAVSSLSTPPAAKHLPEVGS